MRLTTIAFATAWLCPSLALAQAQTAGAGTEWSFTASAYTYFLPDQGNYAQPTVAVDRDWLHLEARYNYEALDTGSLWGGYSWSGGTAAEWQITPMLGGIFGDVSGVAPGYNGSLSWRKLEIYSEGELVFDTVESDDSFFYNWSEIAFVPMEWLRAGLVTQRTHAYDSDRDIQRGVFGGVTLHDISATVYLFNPDDEATTVVMSVGWTF